MFLQVTDGVILLARLCEELSLLTYYTSAGRHTSLASTRVVIAFGFSRLPSSHDRFAPSDVISRRSPDLSFQTAWRALLDPTKPASISALLDLACASDSCASHDATSQSKCDRSQSWPGPTALHAMPMHRRTPPCRSIPCQGPRCAGP